MIPLRLFSMPSEIPLAARLFLVLLNRIRTGHLTLINPEGTQCIYGDPHLQPSAVLHIRDWRACRRIMHDGDIGFAEAYRAGWIDSPDLVAVLRLAIRNQSTLARTITGTYLSRLWYNLRHRLRPNTRTGSRRNIHAHYDLGNEFYGLWLDPTWTYSSAWFNNGSTLSLEDAQQAKYQRIADTLGLRPGMSVLEIGCGWGGFALFAARRGVYVHGLTISREQRAMATARIAEAGLSGMAKIELKDYREVNGQYDAIVSIEMFEAVGEAFWPVYFKALSQRLAPGAQALVQTITIEEAQFPAYRASSDFIREFIFPGGMLPSPERFIRAARCAGLHAETSLSFGQDYAQTLRLWRQAFEARLDAVRAQGFDELFICTWRLYLQYCEAGFAEGRIGVMHFLVDGER